MVITVITDYRVCMYINCLQSAHCTVVMVMCVGTAAGTHDTRHT